MKNIIRQCIRNMRFRQFRKTSGADVGEPFLKLYDRCKAYTMTSGERMFALYQACRYIGSAKVPGDVVECGVYQGGSMMLAALALKENNDTARSLYLYDTYEGMSEPTDKDIAHNNDAARDKWRQLRKGQGSDWCRSALVEVQKNLSATEYPPDKLVFVKGKVEETIPRTVPERIALLRLDTDWYESTFHELKHLFPRLSPKGVIIIDDYGHWKGAREAVDKYFRENNVQILLNRIDYTGRIGIKS